MTNAKRIVCLLLVFTIVLGVFAGCGKTESAQVVLPAVKRTARAHRAIQQLLLRPRVTALHRPIRSPSRLLAAWL